MPKQTEFTTRDLQARLFQSLQEDSIAARNSVARIGAVMIATKQLELNERAHIDCEPVILVNAS